MPTRPGSERGEALPGPRSPVRRYAPEAPPATRPFQLTTTAGALRRVAMSNRTMNLDVLVRLKDLLSGPLKRMNRLFKSITDFGRKFTRLGGAIAALSFMGPIYRGSGFPAKAPRHRRNLEPRRETGLRLRGPDEEPV